MKAQIKLERPGCAGLFCPNGDISGKRIMLRRIFITSAGAMALASAAWAGSSEEQNPPPPSNWDGFYTGMNVGGGFGSPPVCTQSANVFSLFRGVIGTGGASALSQTGCAPVETGGVIGGGQIGYNFKLSNNFLVGLETDISGLSQSGRSSFANATPDRAGLLLVAPVDVANAFVSSEKAVDWLGTVRGRVGWLVTPTFLIYGGGGLAYGGVRGNTNIHAYWTPGGAFTPGNFWTGASGSLSTAQVGWTAGGGVEWMFMTNWSFKVEYLYYDLGPATWANSPNSSFASSSYTLSVIRAGVGIGSVSALAGAPTATNISTSSTRFTGNIVRVGLNFHFH